jgi:hypothetical protein
MKENINVVLEDAFDGFYRKQRLGKAYRYTEWRRQMRSEIVNVTSNNIDTNGFIIVRIVDHWPNARTFDVIGHDSKMVEIVENIVSEWLKQE